MKTRRVLGVDFDDVLFPTDGFLRFWNDKFGTSFVQDQFTHPRFHELLGAPEAEVLLYFEAWVNGAGAATQPYDHAIEVLVELQRDYDLHVVTYRSIEMKDATLAWIDWAFPGVFSDMHFCSKSRKPVRAKSAVYKQIGAVIMLEDHLGVAYELAEAGIHAYVFDKPWNRFNRDNKPRSGAVIHVEDWRAPLLKTLIRRR